MHRRAASACASQTRHSCRLGSESIVHRGPARFHHAAIGEEKRESWAISEEDILPGQTFLVPELAPFIDGNDDSSVNSTAGNDLRSLFDSVVNEFAETRFGFLQLPFGHGLLLKSDYMASQMASQDRVVLLVVVILANRTRGFIPLPR